MVKIMKIPKGKKKPPIKYRKKEYNLLTITTNLIKRGYLKLKDINSFDEVNSG